MGESVWYDCKMAVSTGSRGHEIRFSEIISNEDFSDDRSEAGMYQLFLLRKGQRSPTREIPLGIPESM
jgi:hypothetical protein